MYSLCLISLICGFKEYQNIIVIVVKNRKSLCGILYTINYPGVILLQEETTKFELLGSPWICTENKTPWDNSLIKCKVKFFQKNETVINHGELIECLYYLKKGRIKTVAISPSGHQKILWYMDAGCVFGETAFFNQKPCDYSFIALTECEVHVFPKDVITLEMISKFPDLALSIITMLARKVHVLSTQIEGFAFNKPIVRVSKLIYLLHQRHNRAMKNGTAPIPFTQEEIAEILGMHRVTVNLVIKQLKEAQILDDHTHLITVKDVDKLKEIFT